MKTNKIIPIILALGIIGFTLWYFVNKKESIHTHTHPHGESNVIVLNEKDLATDESDDSLGTIETEYPQVSSFSTADSNKKIAEVEELRLRQAARKKDFSAASANQEKTYFEDDFVFGFYYFGGIEEKDLVKCSLRNKKGSKDRSYPEYTAENFRLQNIEFKDDVVYVQVDADEFPEDVCAEIGVYRDIEGPYRAVHVIVE